MTDPRLARWLDALVATPGLAGPATVADARRRHAEEPLVSLPLLGLGPLVDVGSGGGSPGLPLAAARPDLDVVLLESHRRTCAFLETHAGEFPNVRVICARAEEHGRADGREAYGTAVARALAPPAVAVEWCLPLVRAGGVAILFTSVTAAAVIAAAAAQVGGRIADVVREPGTERRALVVVAKTAATPERFPRRAGVARKRPLA